ncbi:hypothetical protein GCM10010520_12280 [Rhizobium viscosum]
MPPRSLFGNTDFAVKAASKAEKLRQAIFPLLPTIWLPAGWFTRCRSAQIFFTPADTVENPPIASAWEWLMAEAKVTPAGTKVLSSPAGESGDDSERHVGAPVIKLKSFVCFFYRLQR